MKIGFALILLLPLPSVFGQATDPVEKDYRPPREISFTPSSITYESIGEKRHRYTIAGIYNASQKLKKEAKENQKKGNDPSQAGTDPFASDGYSGLSDDCPESIYEATVPDCDEFSVDFERRICTFLTSRKLKLTELADAIDEMARMGGDIPYWAELTARDLEETEDFEDLDFVVDEFEGNFPQHLAWFALSDDKPFEIPLGITSLLHFKVLIVPTTAFCMCHSRYCIRILDTSGKVVWKDSDTAYGGVSVAVAESDGSFGNELLIRRYDHGMDASFIVKLNSEQDGTGQPAIRPESKSEGGDKPQPESEGRSR